MKDFDSLGARQQPPKEVNPVGVDWQGKFLLSNRRRLCTSKRHSRVCATTLSKN